MPDILIIEDNASVAGSLKHLLEAEGYAVEAIASSEAGLVSAEQGEFKVVLTDLQMPFPDGMEVVKRLHEAKPHLPVILMTAHHTTDIAIEAMKHGAFDYVLKPIEDPPLFLESVKKAVRSGILMSEPVAIGVATPTAVALVGRNIEMQKVYKDIGRVAALPLTVLIRGETGTGKELVARAIYQHSNRQDQAFIVVNCAAIPENLLESELFGHEAGAFTDARSRRIGRFEQAHEGTIFLDEIGDMSLGTQVKLLRVLQEKTIQRLGGKETIPVDVRIIAATHRNLEYAIEQKEFRSDLYFRLNVAVIHLPPLRARRDDIPELATYFLSRHGGELGWPTTPISPDAIQFLKQLPWPGNVRELENTIRRLIVKAHGYTITVEDVQTAFVIPPPAPAATNESLSDYVAELLARAERGELSNVQEVFSTQLERELYSQAIRLANGDQTKAAAWLGISRPTMREKLTRYGLRAGKDTSETAT